MSQAVGQWLRCMCVCVSGEINTNYALECMGIRDNYILFNQILIFILNILKSLKINKEHPIIA